MRDLNSETSRLCRWFVIAAVMWSGLIAATTYWNYTKIHQQSVSLASTEALAHFNKDRALRLWGTSHGGIYVPADKRTPPNPRLSHIPERDLTTPAGKKLTLMNPAYMVRQMMHEYEELYGVKGKITAFPDKLFYQGNMPDAWELAALNRFQAGEKEVKEITDINGVSHMRLIRPMFIEQGCLKCHGFQGYQVGDLRGAVGVSVSMQSYLDSEQEEMITHAISLLLIWLIGMLVLGYFFLRARRHAKELFHSQEQYNLKQKLHHKQKMEAIKTLVGGIAHDFNNKLAAITSSVFLAKKEAAHLPEISEKLKTVETLSFQIAEMIQQLLTFTEKERAKTEPLNLAICMKEVLAENRSIIPENTVLHTDFSAKPLIVRGEAGALKDVFIHLLKNAYDAIADERHPTIQIRSEAFEADADFIESHADLESMLFAHLEIKDNGSGIPDEDLERVFEPFYTTKGDEEGKGLGLSLAYGTIRNHNGAIEINSSPGVGTSLHIYLPLIEEDEAVVDPPA